MKYLFLMKWPSALLLHCLLTRFIRAMFRRFVRAAQEVDEVAILYLIQYICVFYYLYVVLGLIWQAE